VELCVKNVEVLKLPYGEVGVNSKIFLKEKIKEFHGTFDVVEGIIADFERMCEVLMTV